MDRPTVTLLPRIREIRHSPEMADAGVSDPVTTTRIANILISSGAVHRGSMAEKTHHETMLSRSEAADYLQELGSDLASESGSWTVTVGNKDVTVRPDAQLKLEATVDERSRLLGDDITEVTVQLRWTDGGESAGGEEE